MTEKPQIDYLVDQALTNDIKNKVTDLVTSINRALDYGLDVRLRVDTAQIKTGFSPSTGQRTKYLPDPFVDCKRELKYT